MRLIFLIFKKILYDKKHFLTFCCALCDEQRSPRSSSQRVVMIAAINVVTLVIINTFRASSSPCQQMRRALARRISTIIGLRGRRALAAFCLEQIRANFCARLACSAALRGECAGRRVGGDGDDREEAATAAASKSRRVRDARAVCSSDGGEAAAAAAALAAAAAAMAAATAAMVSKRRFVGPLVAVDRSLSVAPTSQLTRVVVQQRGGRFSAHARARERASEAVGARVRAEMRDSLFSLACRRCRHHQCRRQVTDGHRRAIRLDVALARARFYRDAHLHASKSRRARAKMQS